eukprot:CAMPEP_0116822822 /NCGR_PEP_ID=MMETSP0418-20121206/487_1 /TAXON_ID=1158023 /ORGANISM="Astrosyne radiata, Strain 13vi08-1A" /LENGTH=435 /DNA_ID=CAMNT_0004450989 /DNA_START=478 /DNA_END=1786 /DNA_ORIENTATION=-
MMSVATTPGKYAGGHGVLGLWSYNRPFMALSVVEGHIDGAVTDFVWLDTPSPTQVLEQAPNPSKAVNADRGKILQLLSTEGTWQHVLSVGRDGQCLLQSFARGDRPISRVPPSCFALANLSPFQRGYGSLQIFSVHQNVPSRPEQDFYLTGLRQDQSTSQAPGVFREPARNDVDASTKGSEENLLLNQRRLLSTPPDMIFNVIDQGDLDEDAKPVASHPTMAVAPEVVHLSRFANSYKLYPDETCPTRLSLCLHNARVAQSLKRDPLARMWRMVASLMRGAGLDQLPQAGSPPLNAQHFALLPTIANLLEERANAGDVQTCVALCEILQVMEVNDQNSLKIRIPGLERNLVREWYLSYIDLLQQMCLFSHATAVIRQCKDPDIAALNQKSTTIHDPVRVAARRNMQIQDKALRLPGDHAPTAEDKLDFALFATNP